VKPLTEDEDVRQELQKMKEEINRLKSEIRTEIRGATENIVSVNVPRNLEESLEPSRMIFEDLTRRIQEGIKKGIAETGEEGVTKLVSSLPEARAEQLVKSLANVDRIKILKQLYNTPSSFGDLKDFTKLEPSSLNHNLKMLLNVRLIRQSESRGVYLLTGRGRFLLRLLAMMDQALGGKEIED
jgi:DNA-binding HxlR family transcriptional regulator